MMARPSINRNIAYSYDLTPNTCATTLKFEGGVPVDFNLRKEQPCTSDEVQRVGVGIRSTQAFAKKYFIEPLLIIDKK